MRYQPTNPQSYGYLSIKLAFNMDGIDWNVGSSGKNGTSMRTVGWITQESTDSEAPAWPSAVIYLQISITS